MHEGKNRIELKFSASATGLLTCYEADSNASSVILRDLCGENYTPPFRPPFTPFTVPMLPLNLCASGEVPALLLETHIIYAFENTAA